MWSYYGSKSKVVDLYPPPKHRVIVEPFAGSARYSLKYWDREVVLYDAYEVIISIWRWLQKSSPKDILQLPSVKKGDNISKFDIPDEAKWLMGFCINRGSVTPKNVVASFCSWGGDKKRISKNLNKIKHWQFHHQTYQNISVNEESTWFIDPPYQFGGEHYEMSNKEIDYKNLKDWSMSRRGQIIVCENTKATWMNFSPVSKMSGSRFTTTEAIWTNLPSSYHTIQQKLL